MKFSVYLVLNKISTETKSASACMVSLPPFFDSFYSNPETRVAKLSIATGVGGCGRAGYRDGKDLGYPRCKTSLSPVALCFAELEPI